MTRRTFLVTALSACAASRQSFVAGIVPAGRNATNSVETFWNHCDEVSALGFHHIEFNNTRAKIAEAYLDRTSAFRDEMARRNLKLAGLALFSRAAARDAPVEQHMRLGRFLEATGGKYITHMIAPGEALNESTDDAAYRALDLKQWAANANEIGRHLLGEHGIKLAYHPEQGEVRTRLYQRVLESTDERYVYFLPDTGHLAAGGADPVEDCRAHRTRLVCVHLKDFKSVKPGDVPFGEGSVNLRGVLDELTGFAGYVMGESGGTNPSMRDYMTGALHLTL
jgi:sugar phosphate isomerase/epimerase